MFSKVMYGCAGLLLVLLCVILFILGFPLIILSIIARIINKVVQFITQLIVYLCAIPFFFVVFVALGFWNIIQNKGWREIKKDVNYVLNDNDKE